MSLLTFSLMFSKFLFLLSIIFLLRCIPVSLLEVFGCAGESDRGKRPIMAKIATDKSDVTILTSDNPKTEDPCKYHSLKSI